MVCFYICLCFTVVKYIFYIISQEIYILLSNRNNFLRQGRIKNEKFDSESLGQKYVSCVFSGVFIFFVWVNLLGFPCIAAATDLK